jgi:hypothetical protein
VNAPRHIRVFVSSPSDVFEERQIAREMLERLPYDPLIRGKMTIDVVAWDAPDGGIPLLATRSPQSAVDLGMPKPSECDIVVVLVWRRLGTPLPEEYRRADGRRYMSGTEWEFEDALHSPTKPEILVYRRKGDISECNSEDDLVQLQGVKEFFANFVNPDGSMNRGYNQYQLVEDFKKQFQVHIKSVLKRLLDLDQQGHRTQTGISALQDSQHTSSGADPGSEQLRRLDAAMPRSCVAAESTEITLNLSMILPEGITGSPNAPIR